MSSEQQSAVSPEEKVIKRKRYRYRTVVILLLIAVAMIASGWWYFAVWTASAPKLVQSPPPSMPTVQPDENAQAATQQLIDQLNQQQRRLALLEIRYYLVQAKQDLYQGRVQGAKDALQRAIGYVSRIDSSESFEQLNVLLNDEFKQLQSYKNVQAAQALRIVDQLLERQASVSPPVDAPIEPEPQLSFWEQPLDFLRTRIQDSVVIKPSQYSGDSVALHPQTLLAQALVLIRTAVVSRDTHFYHLAVENALTIHAVLEGDHGAVHQSLLQLSKLNIVESLPVDGAALDYLETLLGQY